MEFTELEMVIRLGVAMLCGGFIGLERERHAQVAGFRTHMVVAVGASLLMMVSLITANIGIKAGSVADPGRIAAQVVSGIGFLGAGAILRFGLTVKGLTTAASLWTSAGIGLAAGLGYWQGAAAATAFVLVAIFVFDKIEKVLIQGRRRSKFIITAKDMPGMLEKMEKVLKERGIDVQQVGINKNIEKGRVQVTFINEITKETDLGSLTKALEQVEGVHDIEIN